METGLNDGIFERRLPYVLLPAALTLLRFAWILAHRGLSLEYWALAGCSGAVASLVALSAPAPHWYLRALRWMLWLLCFPPLLLDQFGLILALAIAPLLFFPPLSAGADTEEEL